MLDPKLLEEISKGAENVSADLHDKIISLVVDRISTRLSKGKLYLTNSDKYQLEVLQEAGFLLEDIQKEIKKRSKTQGNELKKAFEDAGIETIKKEDEVYKKADISTKPLKQSPSLIRLLERGYKATYGQWQNYTRTTAINACKLYIEKCDEAYNLVATGAVSYSQAFMDAVDAISEEGVMVSYPTGHRDTIEVATARAVRTGVSQACAEVVIELANENDVQCFLTTQHADPRPTHALWQGKVFWVDWKELSKRIGLPYKEVAIDEALKRKYDEFCLSTDIGTITGLSGINCRHSFGAFLDGLSVNPYKEQDLKKEKEAYILSQKQRALERRIRKTKRTVENLYLAKDKADEETKPLFDAQIIKKKNLLTKQVASYYDFCEKNDLKPQEYRIHIG